MIYSDEFLYRSAGKRVGPVLLKAACRFEQVDDGVESLVLGAESLSFTYRPLVDWFSMNHIRFNNYPPEWIKRHSLCWRCTVLWENRGIREPPIKITK